MLAPADDNMDKIMRLDDLWIFGYGSIVWKHDEVKYTAKVSAAHVRGYRRRFWQYSPCHRGTPTKPGLVVSLYSAGDLEQMEIQSSDSDEDFDDFPDEEWRVDGVAFRVTPSYRDKVVKDLVRRERSGFEITWMPIYDRENNIVCDQGMVFVAGIDQGNFAGVKSVEEIADRVQVCYGPSGSNIEYVIRLEEWLQGHGVKDNHVSAVAQAVRDRVGDKHDGDNHLVGCGKNNDIDVIIGKGRNISAEEQQQQQDKVNGRLGMARDRECERECVSVGATENRSVTDA